MTPTQPQKNTFSKNKKYFLRIIQILLILGILAWFGTSNIFSATSFRAYGRSFSVPKDGLKIICVKDLDFKKFSPAINNLDEIMSTIVEACSDNFYAQLYYGNGEVYDMQGQSNSKFKPEEKYLVVLLQHIGNRGGQTSEPLMEYTPKQGEKMETSLMIYNVHDDFKKVYNEQLGKVIALRDLHDDPIQFKDYDEDGNLDLRIRYPLESSLGYMTIFQKTDGSLSVWKHVAPNHHASFSIRDSVIYQGDEPITGVDSKSFVIFNWSYAKDKNRVYGDGGPFDVATFIALDSDGDYVKDKNGVYFEGYSTWAGLRGGEKIEGADPETFQYIASIYSKDKNHVYEFIWPLENGPDPASLELIEDPTTHDTNWMKDKDYVYYNMDIVHGAKPESFKAFNYNFGADYASLFFENKQVMGANLNTFILLHNQYPSYAKDSKQVYFGGDNFDSSPIIKEADPNTFVIITSGKYDLPTTYSKDKNHMFYGKKIIPEADPNTFTSLNDSSDWPRYAKDKNHVYKNEEIIPYADPATFIIPTNLN